MRKCPECLLPVDACSALSEYERAFKFMNKGEIDRAKDAAECAKECHTRYLASIVGQQTDIK